MYSAKATSALCGEFKVIIPQTIEVVSGSCVTIPCSFDRNDCLFSDWSKSTFPPADPPRPTLTPTPSTLEVKKGTSVSLTCSAPAPCLSHPPTLTWTPGLGDSQETLQENQDKTKVQTSVVSFTASHLHHGKTISCTATYNKQDGSTESAVSTSLTADISCDLCGVFKVIMPQTIEVPSGSCVTIPCSFDVENKYKLQLDNTCKAQWKKDGVTVFDSSQPQTTTNSGQLTGDLTKKDCTTTLNNIQPDDNNKKYSFRLDCAGLGYDFSEQISFSVTADPPRPALTSSTLEVKEGAPVSLTCSAPAPCLSHPPTLTWTPGLGDSQETLQENQDKTKVQTSVVSFTASHLHHGKTISCTATYNKQDGSTDSAVRTSLTANISYSPQKTTVSVHPSGPVSEGRDVTLTCSSSANPPVKTYTWYRANGDQETFIGSGAVLNIKASKDNSLFFCKAQNDLGTARSDNRQIDVQYSPQNTIVSVHPLGPVQENKHVTLTCSSSANPPVKNYTWYRADGGQETFIGAGAVLNITASKDYSLFFCEAQNDLGAGRSNISQIDVQFSPQILPSSHCTIAEAQLRCSCRTVGNPSPTLQWYLDGSPVNHSFAISNLSDTGLTSNLTVDQPQEKNLSTLLCRSSNSLGSASRHFCVNSIEPQTSAQSQDPVTLPVFITIVGALLVIVCALLFVISKSSTVFFRNLKTHYNLLKSQRRGDTSTVTTSQLLSNGEDNQVPNTTEEDIYVNTSELRQADVAQPETISEPNSTNLPSSGQNNAEGASESSEKKNEEGNDVIYSAVNWKTKSKKKKGDDSLNMNQPGSSYLEEERCIVGGMGRDFVSNALEMECLYDKVKPRNVEKEVEGEYAQVKFKDKRPMHK
uniref:B-cell receptor CD22-like n=1 Tax=Epinephelus lanceolatus TaxID=310571 RepID=UPI0014458E40|nr:B-cell receptor CD22-like [Epinephelus lanceolatus]